MVSLAEGFAATFLHRNSLQHAKRLSQIDSVAYTPLCFL